MAPSVQTYAYRRPSALSDDRSALALETSGGSTELGIQANPRFFTGFLTRPSVAAKGLRALASVAATRYLELPSERTFRDPVLTCDGVHLRAESFSACGGVYARLDVLPDGLDGDVLARGTTNIDIGETLRRMLVEVTGDDALHLSIGADETAVSRPGETVVERKVPLPTRWLRGFAEAQQIASTFEPRLSLSAAEAARFFRGLGRNAVSGWIVPAGRTWRVTGRAVPGAVYLADSRRLEHLLPLLRSATRLTAYGPAVTVDSTSACAAWEVELPGARLVLLLSPAARRGLSGEGAVLDSLAGDSAADDADLLGAAIAFRPSVEPVDLAETTGLDVARVRAALDVLATAGQVGYDLADAAYFHRVLPFEMSAVEKMTPRLRNARALVARGAVTLVDDARATVAGESGTYQVRQATDGTHCTCQWWLEHRGQRGPCKHVLAVGIVRRGEEGEDKDAGADDMGADRGAHSHS